METAVTPNKRSHRRNIPLSEFVFWAIGLLILAHGLWFYFSFLHDRHLATLEAFAALGDAMAPLVGGVTTLALFAALHGISLQRHELELQRTDLELTRAVLKEQAESAKVSAGAQRELARAQAEATTAQTLGNDLAKSQLQQQIVIELVKLKRELYAIEARELEFRASTYEGYREFSEVTNKVKKQIEQGIDDLAGLLLDDED